MTPVTPEEWGMWQRSNTTKVFMAEIAALREEGIQELASGLHSNDVGKTHLVIGRINALNAVLNAQFEEKDSE